MKSLDNDNTDVQSCTPYVKLSMLSLRRACVKIQKNTACVYSRCIVHWTYIVQYIHASHTSWTKPRLVVAALPSNESGR